MNLIYTISELNGEHDQFSTVKDTKESKVKEKIVVVTPLEKEVWGWTEFILELKATRN